MAIGIENIRKSQTSESPEFVTYTVPWLAVSTFEAVGTGSYTYPSHACVLLNVWLPKIWPKARQRMAVDQDEKELRQECAHQNHDCCRDSLQKRFVSRA